MLSREKWQFASLYLKDIIFLSLLRDHAHQLRRVRSLLRNTGVTLKLKEVYFLTGNIEYPGHAIPLRCLGIVFHTADAIKELRSPTSITKLRSFLELCDVSCCFCALLCTDSRATQ